MTDRNDDHDPRPIVGDHPTLEQTPDRAVRHADEGPPTRVILIGLIILVAMIVLAVWLFS